MNTKNSINESLEVIRRALEDEKNDSNKHSSSNILTLNGVGAHIGIPKAVNGSELSSPANAPASITYILSFSNNNNTLTADIQSGGAWWRFVYDKTTLPPPASYAVTFSVNTANITVGPNGMYAGGGVLGDAMAVPLFDPDGDGIVDRVFQGKNSMKSCELETGNQDTRVRTVLDMAKSKNVKGTTPANKEVIYAVSFNYHSIVAIDADGDCVEVIDREELGDNSDKGLFDEMRPYGLAIRTIDSNDYLVVLGENKNCTKVGEYWKGKGKKRRKVKYCETNDDKPFFYSKNLTTGAEDNCVLDNVTASFRDEIINLRTITIDDGNNLFHEIGGEIYKYPIEKKNGVICPSDSGTHKRYTINSGGNNYYKSVKIEIDPDDTSVMLSLIHI